MFEFAVAGSKLGGWGFENEHIVQIHVALADPWWPARDPGVKNGLIPRFIGEPAELREGEYVAIWELEMKD